MIGSNLDHTAAPTDRRGPGRPRQDDGSGAVREGLIEAATRLFAERGYGAVGLREIAASAGVTPGMVAYYFGGKHGLRDAVLDSVFDQLLEQIRELAATPSQASESIEAFFRLYITRLARDPWIPQLVVREVLFGDEQSRARFSERFVRQVAVLIPELLRNGIAAGRLRDDLDPSLTMLSLVGAAVFPYLSFPLAGGALGLQLDDSLRDRLIAHTSRLFLDGARSAESPPGGSAHESSRP